MDRQREMARPAALQFLNQASAVGNHDRVVSGGGEEGGEFEGAAFDAAGIEFGQDLDDLHAGSSRRARVSASPIEPMKMR